jgi:hypothetical protein
MRIKRIISEENRMDLSSGEKEREKGGAPRPTPPGWSVATGSIATFPEVLEKRMKGN